MPLAGCQQEQPQQVSELVRPVKVRKIQSRFGASDENVVSAVAQGIRESVLSFRVSGTLQKMNAEVGDEVKEGRVVAALDDRDYKLAVEDLENRLKAAQAQLDQMTSGARSEDLRIFQSKVSSARSAEQTAAAEYRRVQGLYSKDAAPRSRLDQAKTQWDQARENLSSAEEEYAKAQAGGREEEIRAQTANVRSMRSNLEKARADLADTRLKVPFSSMVNAKHISNFEQVKAGSPVYTIVDIDQVEVQTSVPESLIAFVSSGQQVKVQFINFPDKEFEGVVTKVGVSADPATLTYPVFVKIANKEHDIRPGMTASVHFSFERVGARFPTVPIHAILEDKLTKSRYVWVVEANQLEIERRDIRIGQIQNEEIEVLEGLQDGELLVVAGVHKVKEGMKVRLPQ